MALYFYTPDGTEALGPVDENGLRKLAAQGVLTPQSFICPSGESEWQQFNPEVFSSPGMPPVPTSPPAKPRPAKKAKADAEEEEFTEKAILPFFINLVAAWGIIRCVIAWFSFPPRFVMYDETSVNAWYALGSAALCLAVPWCFSLLFKRLVRVIVRAVGIALVGFLIPYILHAPEIARSVSQGLHADVAALNIARQLQAKVNDAQTKFNASNIDVTTLKSPDDIAALRAKQAELRQSLSGVDEEARTAPARMRNAMISAGVSADDINETTAQMQQAAHVSGLPPYVQALMKLVDDRIAQLDFLSQNYGKWSVTDGKVMFNDPTAFDAYGALVRTYGDDGKAAQAAQEKARQ